MFYFNFKYQSTSGKWVSDCGENTDQPVCFALKIIVLELFKSVY